MEPQCPMALSKKNQMSPNKVGVLIGCPDGADLAIRNKSAELPSNRDILKTYVLHQKNTGQITADYHSYVASIVTEQFLEHFPEKCFVAANSISYKTKLLWANASAIVNRLKIPRDGKPKGKFMENLDKIFDILSCKCAIKTCNEVGNPLNSCPALIDCICPVKIPSTKLGFLRKQRIRGGGAQEPFIHPSKFRDSRIETEVESKAELDFGQADSAMKESNKTVLSLDSSYNPNFNEITMESEVSKDTKKFCNFCLEEMKQQTLNAAAEIATEVLDKIVSIATKSKGQGTGFRALKIEKMPSTKNISSNAAVKSNNDNENGFNTKVQQIRLTSGELMWALSIGAEPIPGSKKNKIMYKVLGPVEPGQPPPTIIKRPKAHPKGGASTDTIRASPSPSNSIYKSQIRKRRRKQSLHCRDESMEQEINVKDKDDIEALNENTDGELKFESIDIKTEYLETDTSLSTECNDGNNSDGHIVLFKVENHDESNLIKQEIEDPLS